MKFTLSWLKDHLETPVNLSEIVEKLTAIGLEVEDVDDRARFAPFVVARVLAAAKHPDADKLQVLSVDYGADCPIQVVCGAPNARVGLVGVFAPSGTYIPGTNIHLISTKIRGVESHGMMCSERELELSDDHDGIIELPQDLKIGSSYAAWRGLDDPIIDVALTPNRPDCTSVRGIARDLAASGLGQLKQSTHPSLPHAAIQETKSPSINVTFALENDPYLCLGFAWVQISGVKNTPAPQWMQQRLTAIGLRPINAAVDITNYITHDLGRPLHVFDANKIKGDLVVRCAKEGEEFLALDGKLHHLTSEMCVIADETGIQSLAGIMGGSQTGCDENTTDVLIESALWNPSNIAATGRKLGIISDARYRFERGVDPEFVRPGLEIATSLLLDICSGQASQPHHIGFAASKTKHIAFSYHEIKRLTSLEIDPQIAKDILSRLGFTIEMMSENKWDICVPSWRPDVDGSADLVEEILRIYGIDKITPLPLPREAKITAKTLTPLQSRSRNVRRTLAARGMMETISYSFISQKAASGFGTGASSLKLANPIAADMSDMRPSLLPGLLLAAQNNANRGFGDSALFEVGDIYQDDTPQGQRRCVAAIRRGTATLSGKGRFWNGNAAAVTLYDAKADLLCVLEACGLDASKLPLEAETPAYYHPGRSGVIKLGSKNILAYFGEFHPQTLEMLDVSGPFCGFEVFLDALPVQKAKPSKTRPPLILSSLQMLRRDFAFIVNDNVSAATILRAASGADKKLIQSVEVFDVYKDATLGENKKSVAIEVTIQPLEKTLTDAEIENLSSKIIANVIKSTDGILR